ncbi:MAG: Holliday junction resolvase RuvX [Patescibacteria group bacterium]
MGKVLGIDFGDTRIGLAISSDDGHFVFPYQTIENDGSTACLKSIQAICAKEEVKLIIVGLPLDQHGTMGQKAKTVQAWGDQLARVTGCAIKYEDERYSTALANSIKKQAGWSSKKTRATIDQTAASMILQSFLDKQHG